MGCSITPAFIKSRLTDPKRDNICLIPIAETKGGAIRGKRNAFFQKFLPGIFIKPVIRASGIAITLAAIVTNSARLILFIKLCLTAIFDHTIGKRCIETLVDFQNKNTIGYTENKRKNIRSNKNNPVISFS
jgi:hypothetical protein